MGQIGVPVAVKETEAVTLTCMSLSVEGIEGDLLLSRFTLLILRACLLRDVFSLGLRDAESLCF